MFPRLRRTATAVTVALAALVANAAAAHARSTADGWVDDRSGQIGAGAGTGGSSGGRGGGGGGGGSGDGCVYQLLSPADQQTARELVGAGWADAPSGQGAYYRRVCGGTATVVFLAAPPPAVDPQALARQALDRTTIPMPGVRTSPPTDADQIVNMATWLATTNWRAVSASASAGGVTATVTAAPQRTTWSMGNGDVVTCTGPGTTYDTGRPPDGQRPSCSYTYRSSSAGQPQERFSVTATTAWHVTWVATGAVTAGGDFGLVDRSTAVSLRVAEIQTVHE